jgi:hypothetical protein
LQSSYAHIAYLRDTATCGVLLQPDQRSRDRVPVGVRVKYVANE